MAEKNNHMGNDPLAWLANEDNSPSSTADTAEIKKPATRTRTRRATAPKKTEHRAKTDTDLVEESFAAVAGKGKEIVADFYAHLFEQDPDLMPLFEGVSPSGQQQKLLAALVMLVENLRQPEVLEEFFQGLGERHQSYGVEEADYEKVMSSLLNALEKHMGELWTTDVRQAWVKTLTAVKEIMLAAYIQVGRDEMVATNNEELIKLRSAVDGAMTAMMMVDRDFNITYINKATEAMLRPHQALLQEALPGFDVDKLVGANIDIFHKMPERQRKLLENVENLPYSTEIEVGPLQFKLNVTASIDPDGNYIGNTLEWADITEAKAVELEAKSMQMEMSAVMTAIDKVMGTISFDMDGTVIDVNDNFLNVLGYSRDAVIGQHHRKFVEPEYANSPAYAEFWQKLNHGEYDEGQYKRLGINGKEIWLQASYNPVLDEEGKPFKVVKFATDITTEKLKQADVDGQFNAINKVMGVISFNMDGTIIDINDNFLHIVGYSRDEVIGKHHRMFAEADYANSPAYAEFWAKLNRGEFDEGQYKRIGKGGKEAWLQASYNPILDLNGKPFKVVKYATDITQQKMEQADFSGQLNAIDKAMGVISFNMDGTIIDVNQNFLDIVGYSKDEVVGKHHRIFAEPELARSHEYTEFWAKLNRGEYDEGQYKRIGKGGKEAWLQASYNPILDLNGKPYKVVKYAADITEQKNLQFTVEEVLAKTSQVMNAMSVGDLTQTMLGEFEGEFALLQTAINDTVGKISDIVQDITEASISISTAASEISQGNVDLSQRTEEQASSLEETASSMEELTSTVKQNSDNARQANILAASAREKAEKGGEVIQNAIKAMSEISSSSKKVADIIGVIDEIAFQTNLLALNAAVEAARAGEQGRGFAVVASEVRNLAQRSAAAAKEIKALINDSSEKVSEGSSLVDESGRTLEDIVDGAKKVGDIISEIAAAGTEQASGIDQVNKAVTQMDEMTQQNAALVEEAAAASESLDEQGKSLQKMMAFFNTGRTVASAPRAAAPTRAAPSKTVAKPKPASKPAARQVASADDDEWDEF